MKKASYRFWQCLLVLGLAVYLAERWVSGSLSYYINPRFYSLIILSVIVLSGMAALGLCSLFTSLSGGVTSDGEVQAKKIPKEMVVILLMPVLIAILGLSVPVIVSILVLVVILGVVRLRVIGAETREGMGGPQHISAIRLFILAIPLMLGVLVPVRPLTTSSLSTRGASLSAPLSLGEEKGRTLEALPDEERTILDWIRVMNEAEGLDVYQGEAVDVLGFVYHDPTLQPDQFVVSRFVVTCCVADAFPVGMVVTWPDGGKLEDNSWVTVKGTLDILRIEGRTVPAIIAEAVDPAKVPEQPYLYP